MKLALGVRRKILLVVVTLSLVILGFGAFVSFTTLRSASGPPVRYMDEHFARFRFLLEQGGSGDLVAAMLIASDPDVVRALSPLEPPPPDEPRDKERDAEPRKPSPRTGPETPTGGVLLDEALDRLLRNVEVGLDPDLVCIFDAAGEPLSGRRLTKISAAEVKQSRLVQDARSGLVRTRYAILNNVPYLVSAAPVEAHGKRGSVGAVLLGRVVGTFFEQYAQRTAAQPDRQQKAAFLKGNAVLASALPKEEWAPFAAEASKGIDNYKRVTQGEFEVPVIEFSGKAHDFSVASVTGYDGAQTPETQIGQLFLVRSRREQTDQLKDKSLELLAWFAGAGVIACFVGLVLARHITRPIDRYIAATQGIADGQGDLTQRLEVHAEDELGRLAKNLNRVFEQIHALAARVQRTAFRVGDSSDKLSKSSRAMLDGAKTQAVKIENSTAAVTELSASIQQVAENAGEATKVAQKSGAAAENAIHRLGQIQRAVEEAAARIEALGESGKRIGSIVEVIRHISEQTTLLALNAAIEAAHAGEQGRGFAVVADEVSNLAKRVGRSAKDIEDLIATIRDQTSEAVRAMQVGTREVEEGTQLVVSTLADLKTLIGVVEDTATAVNEQAIASDEIARNMDAVRTIAREVLGASEQAATEGAQLTRLAVLLEESVKGFKIDASKVDVDAPPPSLAAPTAARQLPAGGRPDPG